MKTFFLCKQEQTKSFIVITSISAAVTEGESGEIVIDQLGLGCLGLSCI
jgi:hypothetical protein